MHNHTFFFCCIFAFVQQLMESGHQCLLMVWLLLQVWDEFWSVQDYSLFRYNQMLQNWQCFKVQIDPKQKANTTSMFSLIKYKTGCIETHKRAVNEGAARPNRVKKEESQYVGVVCCLQKMHIHLLKTLILACPMSFKHLKLGHSV